MIFSFWQYYIAASSIVGCVIWIMSANQGHSELAALRDGLLAFLVAPMVALLLVVALITTKGK